MSDYENGSVGGGGGAAVGLLLLLVLVSLLLFPGCPRPTPDGHVPPPAKCSGQILEQCGPLALPLVNECLMNQADVVSCILGITKVVGCATYEILSCVVRSQGDAAAAAYQANPLDTRDHWRAQRAAEFLSKTQASFAP